MSSIPSCFQLTGDLLERSRCHLPADAAFRAAVGPSSSQASYFRGKQHPYTWLISQLQLPPTYRGYRALYLESTVASETADGVFLLSGGVE